MATIKVMSWNIQDIGNSKFYGKGQTVAMPQPANMSFAVDYIVSVVNAYSIDVLGIMELRCGLGNKIASMVATALGPLWDYATSSQQQASRQEEALFLWKKSAYLDKWTPPTNDNTPSVSLVNTIDKDSMFPLFKTLTVQQNITESSIYKALLESKYIIQTFEINVGVAYRVDPQKWDELNKGASVVLKDAMGKDVNPGLTTDQMTILKDILQRTDIILFPVAKQRSPYLLYLKLDNAPNEKRLLLSMLHCPGPPSNESEENILKSQLLPAIANMKLSTPLKTEPHLLMMGDFNISKNVQGKAVYYEYDRLNENKVCSFGKTGKIEEPADFFSVIKSDPIGASDLMGNLINTSLSPRSKAEMGREEYRVSPYDKFFFKSKDNVIKHNNTAVCVDLIEAMNFEKFGSPVPVYKQTVAECGMKFVKSRYTEAVVKSDLEGVHAGLKRARTDRAENVTKLQKLTAEASKNTSSKVKAKRVDNQASQILLSDEEIDELKRDISELETLIKTLEVTTYNRPTTTAAAFVVYRTVSDHLPIKVDLTF